MQDVYLLARRIAVQTVAEVLLLISALAGVVTFVLGWGNPFFMVVGVAAVWTAGITMNFSPHEIEQGKQPPALVVLLGPLSGLTSVACAAYLLLSR
jgi:hypothetical protein